MTIFVRVPGEPQPMKAMAAVPLLGERGYDPCAIFQICEGKVPRPSIIQFPYLGRKRGMKIPTFHWDPWHSVYTQASTPNA